MGLLDDAIREHLDLKRRSGADAKEVDKLEHEALGPVRREDIAVDEPGSKRTEEAPAMPFDALADEPVPGEYDSFDEPAASEPPTAHELEDPAGAAEYETFAPEPGHRHLVDPPVEAVEDRPRAAADDIPPPAFSDLEPTAAFEVPDVEREPLPEAREPEPPLAPEPSAEPEPAADPDVVAADPEHDELEETPDFLQETPEHDRLWFEQKPPRDFDF